MTLGATPEAGALPRRGRRLIPAGLPRRGEVLAVVAMAIVAGHLALAPLTLVVALILAAAGRASRWRLWWLLIPAAAGLAWVLLTGPGAALAGFTAWPSGFIGSLHRHLSGRPAHPGHPSASFRAAWSMLPAQLPVALICGAAEAAVLGWLVWLRTDEWAVPAPRPGVIAALRAGVTGAAIRAGAVLTRDGCALGVMPATGAIAELSWAEMSGGLLVTGDDHRDVTLASLQVVHAALRRRKPLIVIGLSDATGLSGTDGPGDPAGLGRALAIACLATGTPLQADRTSSSAAERGGTARPGGVGWRRGVAEPGSIAEPASAAGPAGGTGGAGSAEGAERAAGIGSASALWGRAREGRTAGPQAVRTPVDLHRVIMERAAVRLPADSPELAAGACADVVALASDLRALGVGGDGLVWVPRGELIPAEDLAALLRDAPAAGLSVLVGATSSATAAELAGLAGATLINRVADPGLAARLADLTGTRMLPAAAAARLAGEEARPYGPPVMPPVPSPPTGAMPPAAAAPPAAPAPSGFPSLPGTDLVRCPVIPARNLRALGAGEFVLAVHVPRGRLIALGRLVPARLPHRKPANRKPPHREPSHPEPPYGEPPYREPSHSEPPFGEPSPGELRRRESRPFPPAPGVVR